MASPSKRAKLVGGYLQKTGVRTIAEHFSIGQWAVRKWVKQGYVPNARLEGFCGLTGAPPEQVCDPDIDFIFKTNATKGSR